ncbi:reverse transcriptase domain-containing protein [Tanacetum coccineum]
MLTTRQGMNSGAIEQLIAQLIADAIAAYEANRNNKSGTQNEVSGSDGKVTSSKPTKIQEAIRMAHKLMDQVVRAKAAKDADNKRKWEDDQEGNHCQQQNKRHEVVRVYAAGTVEPELRTIVETPVATIADKRTMSELLQAPTEGYGDAIIIPAILAENFELKVGLLQLVTSSQFHGFERDDPHSHIRWFNKITSTLKYKDVPHEAIKLILFPFSLEGASRIWLEKEPPHSIHTWEDLVSKFVNYFFPPSKTTNLKNDITNFQQRFDETFSEAWDRFKDLLRKCPHHSFSKLHQIDTFYNALTQSDQDSLNAAAGGNLLNRTPRDAFTIIENKSKVRISRNKPIVSKVSTTTSSPSPSLDVTSLTEIIKELVLMNKDTQQATVKAIKETCVTYSGPHPYYECLTTGGNTFDACAAVRTYNQGGNGYRPQGDLNYRASNQMGPPGFPLPNVQNSQNYNQNRQSPSSSGLLPSDTVANPRGDVKAITTQSSVAYEGPSIPPTSPSLPKEVEREPEVTRDKVQTISSESTAHVQPSVVQVPILKPKVSPKPNPKPSIPYPSRLNNQKLQEKKNNQMMKFLQIFQRLHFDISFADALLHMPKFASTFKSLLTLADLGASINLMPLSVWKKLSLSELTPTLDYDVDHRVPLILGRPFLKTARALIDVHGEELTLRVNDEAIMFKVGHTSRNSRNYYDESVNQINVIDVACEEYAQEVLGFLDSSTSGNPTPSDPIIASFSPSFTLFEGGDFILEEIETFLHTPDNPSNLDDDYYDTEGDILYLEKLLNEDPSPNLFLMKNKDLKQVDVTMTKPSIEEPSELELKDLPLHLEYAFLEGTDKLLVIISKELKDEEKAALLKVLKSHKWAIAWKIFNIKGIYLRFYTHKILMEDDFKPTIQHQRRVNLKIHEVIKKEVIKLLDAGLIYPISDSPWVSPVHCMPKKGGMTVVENEDNELIPTRLVTGCRVCIVYKKLNDATRKDKFPLPFMDQMLERLAGNEYYCFLDGFLGYFQIPIDPQDQEKTTFTCPYGTFAYRRMPFGLCNALSTFQRCVMAIFHNMIEEMIEVFMDDFSVFEDSFSSRLSHLDKMLKCCEDTNLVLNWEKYNFMVKEGIVLGHKILKSGIEVDRAKVDVIAKHSHLTSVKGVQSFLGHAEFYRRFIQDFSKIARPMTQETLFIFLKECIEAFNTLKKKLTEAPILVAPNWGLPFEIMCDASDFAVGAVFGQLKTKHFQPIHYASKTMTDAQAHYTTTEKELLAVVYAFEKLWPYLVLSKTIVYTDHPALKYLLTKQDVKSRLLRSYSKNSMSLFVIKKGAENLAADHLSRLENPHQDDLENKEINETFPLETLGMISSRSDSSTPWFSDIANYHTGNFVVKGASSQQKKKFFKDAKSHKRTKCLKMQFKFARSLTYGASILWDRSHLLEGTSTFSWPLTTYLNVLKRKRSPLMMPELS